MASHTRFWTAALIIALVIVGGFALSVPRAGEAPEDVSLATSAEFVPPVVTLRDTYHKGARTLSGSLMAPDACTSVAAEATVVEGRIQLGLTLPLDEQLCLEVPTERKFEVTLEAPEEAPVEVRVNGVLVVASTTTAS